MANWEFDAAHSLIEFSAKHMMVTTVKGRFTDFSGVFELDEQNPEASKVDVNINVASLSTGAEQRDGHLRSPDFFDADNYPHARFASTQVQQKSQSEYAVTGNLTIRGVTRPVTLDISLEGDFTNMYGKRIAAFTTETTINRRDWGLDFNVALESGGWLVSEKVKISIEAQLTPVSKIEADTVAAAIEAE